MIGDDIEERVERKDTSAKTRDTSSAAMIAVISLPQHKAKKRQKLTKLDAI